MPDQPMPTLFQTSATGTSGRIVQSLKQGFRLGDAMEQAICADQHAANIDNALAQWLRSLLLLDEHQFAGLLMPLIAQRFESYVNHLRSNSPWIQ